MPLANALIRLRVCAGWSEALLDAPTTLLEISCHGSYVLCTHNMFWLRNMKIKFQQHSYLEVCRNTIYLKIQRLDIGKMIVVSTLRDYFVIMECNIVFDLYMYMCSSVYL